MASDSKYIKYSLITSVDVKRSFSSYINLLADNKRAFLFENLKHALMIQRNIKE